MPRPAQAPRLVRLPRRLRRVGAPVAALRRRGLARRRRFAEDASDGSFAATARCWTRGALIGLALVAVWCVWMACQPWGRLRGTQLRPLRRFLLRLWGRWTLWVLNCRLEVSGTPPKPPYFLVANHLGYADILILTALLGPVFIAMAEMSTWPFLGKMMGSAQQLFIDRNGSKDVARVLASIHEVLDQDDGIIVFAEARCSRGLTVLPFRPALIEAAAARRFPVHYATLSYRTPPGSPAPSDAISWWRWEGAGSHLNRFLRLPGFTATIHFGEEPVPASNRKVMARALHEAVLARFVPLQQGFLPELPAPPDVPRVYLD